MRWLDEGKLRTFSKDRRPVKATYRGGSAPGRAQAGHPLYLFHSLLRGNHLTERSAGGTLGTSRMNPRGRLTWAGREASRWIGRGSTAWISRAGRSRRTLIHYSRGSAPRLRSAAFARRISTTPGW